MLFHRWDCGHTKICYTESTQRLGFSLRMQLVFLTFQSKSIFTQKYQLEKKYWSCILCVWMKTAIWTWTRKLKPSDCLIITSVFRVSVPLCSSSFYCKGVWGWQTPRVNQPNEKPCSSEEMITSGRKALDWLRDCVGTGQNQQHFAFHSVSLASARKDVCERVCVCVYNRCFSHKSACSQALWWSLQISVTFSPGFLTFCNLERT